MTQACDARRLASRIARHCRNIGSLKEVTERRSHRISVTTRRGRQRSYRVARTAAARGVDHGAAGDAELPEPAARCDPYRRSHEQAGAPLGFLSLPETLDVFSNRLDADVEGRRHPPCNAEGGDQIERVALDGERLFEQHVAIHPPGVEAAAGCNSPGEDVDARRLVAHAHANRSE